MADPLTIAAVGLQGISLISNLFGASKQEKAAKRQAEEEARIEREVTAERLRQIDVEESVLRGETVARTAASGVRTTVGSPLQILAEQAYEFERERAITENVGASKAKAALDRGEALAERYQQQGLQSAFGAGTSIFSILATSKYQTGKYFG